MRFARSHNIRVRLAAIFAATMAVLLAAYATTAYGLLRKGLYDELDRQLTADFKVGEELMEHATRTGGRPRLDEAVPGSQPAETPPGQNWRWLEIWDLNGELVYGNPEDPNASRHLSWKPAAREFGPASVDLPDGVRVRVFSARLDVLGTPVIIRVLRSEEGVQHELWEFLRGLLIALPVAVVLAGIAAYLLTRAALAPLVEIADRAKTITADRLGERLPVTNPDDEVGQLATIFNDTLSRLEQSFDRLRRFTADASHELRTPLTAIRSVGEIGLRGDRQPAQYREIIGSLLEEADRLSHVVDGLLTLSRADSGQLRPVMEPLDLAALGRDVCEFLSVLAEEKGQRILVQTPPAAFVQGDRLLLRQAVVNLVDNAVKYSPPDSQVRVAVRAASGGLVTLEVADEGPGIPAADQPRVFDRFYRVDRARSRAHGGSGLGLSIAHWVVEACGGRITVESEDGRGSTFRIVLAAADAPATPSPLTSPAIAAQVSAGPVEDAIGSVATP